MNTSLWPPVARAAIPLCVAFAFALLALFANPAEAAVVKHLRLENLVGESVAIVRGKVIGQRSEWAGNCIVTRHLFQITAAYKGPHAANSKIVVTTMGGEVGNVGQICCGEATLIRQEDVILFLWKDSTGNLRVFGLNQGKFRLLAANDPRNPHAEPMVENSFEGLIVIDPDSGERLEPRPISLPLSQFETRLRQLVAGPNSGTHGSPETGPDRGTNAPDGDANGDSQTSPDGTDNTGDGTASEKPETGGTGTQDR